MQQTTSVVAEKLVSVVMPAFNAELTVREAAESVLAQTHPRLELIIVNDASEDGTAEVIAQLASRDTRILTIDLPKNGGPGVARNAGLAVAAGDFVAFLDADDLWHSDKLMLQLQFMVEGGFAFSCTYYDVAASADDAILFRKQPPTEITKLTLLQRNCIGCLTVMLNTSRLGEIKFPELRKRQDYALWLSIADRGFSCHTLDKSLATYRRQSKSVSSAKLGLIYWNYKMFRSQAGLSPLGAAASVLLNVFFKLLDAFLIAVRKVINMDAF